LAAASGAHPRALHRFLRALSSIGLLKQVRGGQFELTALGERLRTDSPGSLHGLAMLYGDEWYYRAWAALVHSVRTGGSAFELVYGVSLFEYRRFALPRPPVGLVRRAAAPAARNYNNLKKRLVKAPKVYIRDTGLHHTLLRIGDAEELHGHPALGPSFEGFAIEQILNTAPATCDVAFYRTHTGVEIDLVLTPSGRRRIGVEVKYTAAPKVTEGLRVALTETECTEGYVVTAGREAFALGRRLHTVPLPSPRQDGSWSIFHARPGRVRDADPARHTLRPPTPGSDERMNDCGRRGSALPAGFAQEPLTDRAQRGRHAAARKIAPTIVPVAPSASR
jgi:hypothetical protein